MPATDKATQVTEDSGESGPRVDPSDGSPPGVFAIGDLDDSRLAELYAYPTNPDHPWIRANFITSIDGAVTIDGLSGGLGTPADQRVYHLQRSLCDVVLVGRGTVLAENYGPVSFTADVREHRIANGLTPVPPVAVVTGSADLPVDHRLFTPGEAAPIILTGRRADQRRVEHLEAAGARVLRLPDDSVRPADIRATLADLHLLRVLCEGGPSLIGSLLEADLIDDFCLTTSPILCAGDAGRAAVSPRSAAHRARRVTLLTDDDGTVLTRWLIEHTTG